MKLLFALVMLLAISAFGQTGDLAKGTYAKNGVLISLTDLVPLQNCSIKGMKGKVKSVKIDGDTVTFDLKKKRRTETFQFSLTKLGPPERRSLRRGLMKKGIPLSASGYACTDDGPVQAISIDRSY